VSTATLVPETWNLTGDDARETLAGTPSADLMRDSIARLRAADGFSHARSIAYLTILVFVQAAIGAVGLASAFGSGVVSTAIVRSIRSIVPGPVGQVLTDAVAQAHRAGTSGQWIAIVAGTVGALVTGTTLFGQIERALNRIYGVEDDRDTVQKYGRALVLAVTAGVLSVLAFVGLALGRAVASSLGGDTASTIWNLVRWPISLGMLVAATALIFRLAPRRSQPSWSWLSFGALAAVGMEALVTVVLNLLFQLSSTFGSTYGPLAGIVALSLWTFLAAIALLLGASLAAQLEAIRAGVVEPRSERKVTESEPYADSHMPGHSRAERSS
jgi:YihY family inner membrane protein